MKQDPSHFLLQRKNLSMLLSLAAVVVALVATVIYAVTGDVILAVAVAVVLAVTDFIGLKMMIRTLEQKNRSSSPKDE